MTLHFQREVEKLKRMILNEAAVVEASLQKAIQALKNRDLDLARQVVESDDVIDAMEIEVEEESLKILALHQPVAIDLRFIISTIKINNDLERIGDLAANLAARTAHLARTPEVPIAEDIFIMASLAQMMVKESLDALVNMNVSLAETVCDTDEQVDILHKKMFVFVEEAIKQDIENIDGYMQQLGISRYLERIADHATNIAEDVMYMVEGEIRRHIRPNGED